jgi:hypothetical protein
MRQQVRAHAQGGPDQVQWIHVKRNVCQTRIPRAKYYHFLPHHSHIKWVHKVTRGQKRKKERKKGGC